MAAKVKTKSGRALSGQGTVRPRRNGLLEWRFYERVRGRAQRFSVYGRTQTELRQERDKKLRLVFGPGVPGKPSPTYAECANSWLEKCRGLLELGEMSFKTFGQYEWLTTDYIAPQIGEIQVDRLTLDDLEAVLDAVGRVTSRKTGHRLSKQTVGHAFSALRRSLYYARKHGWTQLDVSSLMEQLGERVTVRKYKPYRLTSATLLRFHESAAKCEHGRIFTAALAVLGREAEVLGLRWKNVDVDAGVIHVREELQFLPPELRPKDDPNGAVIVQRVKTDLDEEQAKIEVGPRFIKEVRAAREETLWRRSDALKRGKPWQDTVRVMVEGRLDDLRDEPNDLVFVTDGGKPMSPKVLRDHFVEICERAGIPYSARGKYGLRIHDLRGSAAVLLLTDKDAPVSPSEVMRRGRWSSWQMLKYYTEIWERAQKVIAEKADRLAFGA